MQHLDALLHSHPRQPSTLDLVRDCVAACQDCSITCNACADACLSEKRVEEMRECIRLDLDCAAICTAAGSIVSRMTRPHKASMEALLTACVEACRVCEAECEKHAAIHAHCRVCAEACHAGAAACTALLSAIR